MFHFSRVHFPSSLLLHHTDAEELSVVSKFLSKGRIMPSSSASGSGDRSKVLRRKRSDDEPPPTESSTNPRQASPQVLQSPNQHLTMPVATLEPVHSRSGSNPPPLLRQNTVPPPTPVSPSQWTQATATPPQSSLSPVKSDNNTKQAGGSARGGTDGPKYSPPSTERSPQRGDSSPGGAATPIRPTRNSGTVDANPARFAPPSAPTAPAQPLSRTRRKSRASGAAREVGNVNSAFDLGICFLHLFVAVLILQPFYTDISNVQIGLTVVVGVLGLLWMPLVYYIGRVLDFGGSRRRDGSIAGGEGGGGAPPFPSGADAASFDAVNSAPMSALISRKKWVEALTAAAYLYLGAVTVLTPLYATKELSSTISKDAERKLLVEAVAYRTTIIFFFFTFSSRPLPPYFGIPVACIHTGLLFVHWPNLSMLAILIAGSWTVLSVARSISSRLVGDPLLLRLVGAKGKPMAMTTGSTASAAETGLSSQNRNSATELQILSPNALAPAHRAVYIHSGFSASPFRFSGASPAGGIAPSPNSQKAARKKAAKLIPKLQRRAFATVLPDVSSSSSSSDTGSGSSDDDDDDDYSESSASVRKENVNGNRKNSSSKQTPRGLSVELSPRSASPSGAQTRSESRDGPSKTIARPATTGSSSKLKAEQGQTQSQPQVRKADEAPLPNAVTVRSASTDGPRRTDSGHSVKAGVGIVVSGPPAEEPTALSSVSSGLQPLTLPESVAESSLPRRNSHRTIQASDPPVAATAAPPSTPSQKISTYEDAHVFHTPPSPEALAKMNQLTRSALLIGNSPLQLRTMIIDLIGVVHDFNFNMAVYSGVDPANIIGRSILSVFEWLQVESMPEIMATLKDVMSSAPSPVPRRFLLRANGPHISAGELKHEATFSLLADDKDAPTDNIDGVMSEGRFSLVLDVFRVPVDPMDPNHDYLILQQPLSHVICESLPFPLCMLQPDGTIAFWSDAIAHLVERDPFHMVGRNAFTELLGTWDKPLVNPQIFPFTGDVKVHTSKGPKTLTFTLIPWYEADGCDHLNEFESSVRNPATAPLICLMEKNKARNRDKHGNVHILQSLGKLITELNNTHGGTKQQRMSKFCESVISLVVQLVGMEAAAGVTAGNRAGERDRLAATAPGMGSQHPLARQRSSSIAESKGLGSESDQDGVVSRRGSVSASRRGSVSPSERPLVMFPKDKDGPLSEGFVGTSTNNNGGIGAGGRLVLDPLAATVPQVKTTPPSSPAAGPATPPEQVRPKLELPNGTPATEVKDGRTTPQPAPEPTSPRLEAGSETPAPKERRPGDRSLQSGWARLVSRDPSVAGSCPIVAGVKDFRVGRSAQCTLVVKDPFVSSVQFRIARKPGGKAPQNVLTDMSVNGTYVNVKKVGKGKSYVLKDGDLITFQLSNGRHFLGFRFELVSRANRDLAGAADQLGTPSRILSKMTTLGGEIDWKIGEEMLGKGGNAEVYLGINLTNGKLIAVKRVLLPKDANAKQLRQYQALQEEIALISTAQHPNIVQYYGTSQSSTHLHILLEFVPGGSIRHLLDNFGALAEGVIIRYIGQVLEGLEYLHGRQIVHADLKCANVLVTDKGEVKITDFGTATLLQDANKEAEGKGKIRGTLLWMAPEIIRDSVTPTFASDIWSVGCCLIEMMTGEHPWFEYEFESEEHIMNLLKYTTEPPEIPACSDPLLSTITHRCLALNPVERPTATELLKILGRKPPPTPQLAASTLAAGSPPNPSAAEDLARQGSAVPASPTFGLAAFPSQSGGGWESLLEEASKARETIASG
jgi:tRNA A-37 threonylcarbamoyl transferase component Bud32